ncbi:MAG: serine/threonine-protein phosphatase [Chitinivibrionia bacterium]|nr:serine/threonine-protein phosphatase [Chitinivibrionia bacterium]
MWAKENEEKYEIFELRKQIATNSQISEFISDIYNAKEFAYVFKSLITRLSRMAFSNKFLFLDLDCETAELKANFSYGFKQEERPYFTFNIFEIHDNEIISTIFEREVKIVSNGFESANELSLRLDMDNYVMIPLVYQADNDVNIDSDENDADENDTDDEAETEEFCDEKKILKDPYFPVSGIFVFGYDNLSDFDINENIPTTEQLIHIAGITMNNILVSNKLRQVNEKYKAELLRARAVQKKLLPENLPSDYFLQAFAFYKPVDEIGGDYYDLFLLDKGIYAIFIADVAGHGASAALIMAATKTALKAIASVNLEPAQTLKKMNDTLVNSVNAGRHLTAFYAIIDTNQSKITYANAGHCPTLVFNKISGEYQMFQSGGFYIGTFLELDPQNYEYNYQKDENRLILYTDGITDCQNRDGAMYGLVRLQSAVVKTLDKSPESASKSIAKELKYFKGCTETKDDQTLLIVDF